MAILWLVKYKQAAVFRMSLGLDKVTVAGVQLSENKKLNKNLSGFSGKKLLNLHHVVVKKPSRSNHVDYMRKKRFVDYPGQNFLNCLI